MGPLGIENYSDGGFGGGFSNLQTIWGKMVETWVEGLVFKIVAERG